MTDFNIRNFVWVQPDSIDLEVEHPVHGWMPFTANEDDVEEHGRQIFAQAKSLAGPFVAPPPPPPAVPQTISDRQFFQVLANRQLITKQEALAAVSVGTLPAAMDALLAGMSDEDEFAARMLLQGATQFNRSHPLTQAFGAGFGMTPEQIDELWIEADAL